MKFIVLISVILTGLLFSGIDNNILQNSAIFVGAAPTYQCKKEMTGIFRGPCKTHCEQFCVKYYHGTGECDELHKCVCTYSSPIRCDS
ncbi:hypothetical protein MKW92_025763 [Papaver armeniacum]|nr:hypothetical protein MKW92_053332 [Papaver armeniacum]KAI3972425.1 hypothetical protein MKW92_025763 [Papaver armeniacum]